MINRIIKLFLQDRQYLLRQIKNRTLAKLFYKVLRSKSFFLNEITILLTYKCNLKCMMCPQYGKYGLVVSKLDTTQTSEITTLKKFIDEVSVFKPSIITLSGGEPFLYLGWEEIANYIKQKNIKTALITNGVLLDKFADEIINNVDILHISLDGLENIHNKIRGSGVFEKVISNIRHLQKKNEKKPQVVIAYTFSQDNFYNLEDFILYFARENIKIDKFIFQHLLFLSNNLAENHQEIFAKKFKVNSNFWSGFLFEPEGINTNKLGEEISKIKKKFPQVIFKPNFKLDELKKYYEDKNYLPVSYKRCISPYLSLTLLPTGEVWICPAFSIGNIKENSFAELWNNAKATTIRSFLQKEKLLPACRACCYLYEY